MAEAAGVAPERDGPVRGQRPPALRGIAAHPLLSFFALACAIGWLPYAVSALGADFSPSNEPLGPALAAAIAAACAGRGALRAWGRGLLRLRAPVAAYALAAAAPIAIAVGSVALNHAFGAPLPSASQLAAWPALPLEFALNLVMVGFGEEAGWTAFAAPRLLRRHRFVQAWAIAATLRTAWHLPLMLSGQLPWVLGLGGNPAFQLLVLWMMKRSGERWFLAALWHAVLNAFGGGFFFPMVQGEDQARLGVLLTAGYVLAAAAVFWLDGRDLDRRFPLEPGGEDAGVQPRS